MDWKIISIVQQRSIRKTLLCYFLLAYVPVAVNSWKNILRLTVADEVGCITACAEDFQCSRWNFYPSPQTSVLNVTQGNSCFLESKTFAELEKIFNSDQGTEKTRGRTSGVKRLRSDKGFVGAQTLVSGPVAFDSTTLLNFPQHFVRGCSYTISLWLWLWKTDVVENRFKYRRESIIFNTYRVDSGAVSPEYEPLFPAIIYNLRSKPGKFFFSTTKDEKGDYSGFFPDFDIKYNEWMHITLTATNDDVAAYINGKYVSNTRAVPSKMKQQSCPYYNFTGGDASDNILQDQNVSMKVTKDATALNTIFEVIGQRDGPANPGMMQDLTVIRGLALSEDHVKQLMNVRTPITPPTLKKLLRLHGVYSLEGYSVRDWEKDFYRTIEWGVCPISVCGPVCLPEKFLLGLSDISSGADNTNRGNEADYFNQLLDDFYSNGSPQKSAESLDPESASGDDQLLDMGLGSDSEPEPGSERFFNDPGVENMGDSDVPAGYYDDYYDSYGNPKPLTAEQKDILASYGYEDYADYDDYGYADGEYGGDDIGLPQQQRDLNNLDFNIAKRSASMGKSNKIKSATGAKELGGNKIKSSTSTSPSEQTSKTGKSKIKKVEKIGRMKVLDKNGDNADNSSARSNRNSTSSKHSSVIVLPRRHAFKQMIGLPGRGTKKKSSDGSSSSTSPPGSSRFRFMDYVTPAAVMEYVNNAYRSFAAPANKEEGDQNKIKKAKSSKSKSESKSQSKSKLKEEEGDEEQEEEYDSNRMSLLELDSEEESYLTYHPVGKVQALYDAAMIWLNGRHADFKSDVTLLTHTDSKDKSHVQYREEAVERATSALTLALWLSDDLRTEYEDSSRYTFPVASDLSLPIHTVLGYLYANGGGHSVRGLERAEEVLNMALGGTSLTSLFDTTSSPTPAPTLSPTPSSSLFSSAYEGTCSNNDCLMENTFIPSEGTDLFWHTLFASHDSSDFSTLLEKLNILREENSSHVRDAEHSEQQNRQSILSKLSLSEGINHSDSVEPDATLKTWVKNYREPSGVGGVAGRLSDADHTTVSRLLDSLSSGDYISENRRRSLDSITAQERDKNVLASMHYFPAAQHVMTHHESLRSNTGMQVVHDLIHLWRADEGAYYTHPIAGNAKDSRSEAEKEAAEGYYQEYTGERKKDRYRRKVFEAESGDVQSQVWLGKQIFSDNGGDDRIVTKSRIWFEKAATKGDPVANYIMGVLMTNHFGGLKNDFDKEVAFFKRATSASNPFPMAWHALGDLYSSEAGWARARGTDSSYLAALEYYSLAAEYDLHESHFRLAVLLKEGHSLYPANIPQSVVHFTIAATLGSMKAASHLAHAFYDNKSWLNQYSNLIIVENMTYQNKTKSEKKKAKIPLTAWQTLLQSLPTQTLSELFKGSGVEVAKRITEHLTLVAEYILREYLSPEQAHLSGYILPRHDAKTSEKIRKKWMYNSSVPLFVTLPGVVSPVLVPLPFPLWRLDSPKHTMLSDFNESTSTDHRHVQKSNSTHTHKANSTDMHKVNSKNVQKSNSTSNSSIEDEEEEEEGEGHNDVTPLDVSTVLLKYIVQFSDRPLDLMEAASDYLIEGNIWEALELYEESADMGSQFAEDNAVFLYDILMEHDCTIGGSGVGKWDGLDGAEALSKLMKKKGTRRKIHSSPGLDEIHAQRNGTYTSKQFVLSTNASSTDRDREISECRAYLTFMSNTRLTHMANGGNFFAARVLADKLLQDPEKLPHSSLASDLSKYWSLISEKMSTVTWYKDILHLIGTGAVAESGSTDTCEGVACDSSSMKYEAAANRSAEVKAKGLHKADLKGAARLYAIAASHGDVRSLLSLGWLFTALDGDIPRNLTAASSVFASALQWESYLPSLFSSLVPPSQASSTHPVKEFRQVSPTLSTGIYQVRDNTVGVAPLFALTYMRFLALFDEQATEQEITTAGPSHSLLGLIAAFIKNGLSRFLEVLMLSKNVLTGSEDRTLLSLGVTFFVLLVTIVVRLQGRRVRQ